MTFAYKPVFMRVYAT